MYRLGKYQLVARLGTGGMAEVWRARLLGAPDAPTVVIKRVLPGHAHDPAFVRSLRTEANALVQLRHPGIVRLHALEEIDGQLLLVLEHVDGCDLRALQKSVPAPPPPGLGAYVVAEVCRALGHAHRFAGADTTVRSILHRDVSPSNVMVTRDGEVKLVDFGIAKALFDAGDELTRSRSIKGKLSYMAPEQLDGQPLSCAADVYSAGVLLHELLTGRRLFTIASPLAMAMLHEVAVAPPSSVNPAVPPGLDAVCLRALARDPAVRFADGHEMAAALAPFARALSFGRHELRAMVAQATALEAEATAATATVKSPPSATPTPTATATARRGRRAAWAALALLPLVGVAAWALRPRASRPAPAVARAAATGVPVTAAATPVVPATAAANAPATAVADAPATAAADAPAKAAAAKPAHKHVRSRPHLSGGTLAPF